ncbi:MAG: MATE family efflux transporter [Bacillota bacterium]|nr:MATE family efflux transporter [Bacillota bacterium]
MNNKNDFSKGSVKRTIIRLAIPMTFAQLINLLYNIVDRMFIGRIPQDGTLALTGLGLCFPIIMIVTAFTNLFGVGGAPLSSIERGKGNNEEAQNIMGNSFTLLIMAGIVLTVLGLLFKKPILYLFGASDATYPFANQYLSIYLLGSIFVMISLGMNSYINNQGFAKIGMLTTALGCITNIVLDPILIFGCKMGVQGAALATIFSQGLSAIWVLRFLTGNQTILRLERKSMRLKWSRVKAITSLGLAGCVMQFTNSAVTIVCNRCLSLYGGDLYVGVMTIMNSIREILSMPVMGITNGATPVLSFNYGAKNYHRVIEAIKFMSITTIAYTFVSWLVLVIIPEPFIKLFNNDPSLTSASIQSIYIYFFGFFMMALQFAGQTVFTALGKSKQAVFFSIFRKIVIVVPLTILIPMLLNNGVDGVFMAEPISNFIGGGACFLTMMLTVWKDLKRKIGD